VKEVWLSIAKFLELDVVKWLLKKYMASKSRAVEHHKNYIDDK
jgi:hypothetical protein